MPPELGSRSSGPLHCCASSVSLSESLVYWLASSSSAPAYALKMASLSSLLRSSKIWLNTLQMPSANTCAVTAHDSCHTCALRVDAACKTNWLNCSWWHQHSHVPAPHRRRCVLPSEILSMCFGASSCAWLPGCARDQGHAGASTALKSRWCTGLDGLGTPRRTCSANCAA